MYKRRYLRTDGTSSRLPTKFATRSARRATNEEVMVDTKHIDVVDLNRNVANNTAGVLAPAGPTLCQIAIGGSSEQREGRSVVITGVHFKGTLVLQPGNTLTASGPCCVRIILVQDRQCNKNSTAITSAQIFTSSAVDDNVNMFMDLNQEERFQFLYDKTYVLNPTTNLDSLGTDYPQLLKHVEFKVNTNIKIDYDQSAATGAITTIMSNNLFFVYQTNQGWISTVANRATPTNPVQVSAITRVEYIG